VKHTSGAATLLALWLVAAAPDPVVAIRGTDQLTAAQLHALIATTPADTQQKLIHDPAALQTFITQYFVQRAILAQATQAKWAQRPDVAAVLAKERDQVILQTYLAVQAAPPANYPSEAELQTAYDLNKQKFLLPRTYHLERLLLAVLPSAAPADATATLAKLRQNITSGAVKFASAGTKNPGVRYQDLGFVPESSMVEPVRKAVVGLLEGNISDPICVPGGCNLIKLTATRPAGPATLPQIHDTLIKAMRQQREKQNEQAYAGALLAKQPIKIDQIALDRITTP
jgi:peptidylprolyl isomerase